MLGVHPICRDQASLQPRVPPNSCPIQCPGSGRGANLNLRGSERWCVSRQFDSRRSVASVLRRCAGAPPIDAVELGTWRSTTPDSRRARGATCGDRSSDVLDGSRFAGRSHPSGSMVRRSSTQRFSTGPPPRFGWSRTARSETGNGAFRSVWSGQLAFQTIRGRMRLSVMNQSVSIHYGLGYPGAIINVSVRIGVENPPPRPRPGST